MRTLTLFLALVCASTSVASAEVRTTLVVLLGVELDDAHARSAHNHAADLARQGIELFVDPSMTWDPKPPERTYAGRVLARQLTDRTVQATRVALPSPADVAAVAKALGVTADDIRVVALIAYSGGK